MDFSRIAHRTGLPKPTMSRLTYTLTKLGYLRHNIRLGKYQLGSAVLSIGYPLLASMSVRQIARPTTRGTTATEAGLLIWVSIACSPTTR